MKNQLRNIILATTLLLLASCHHRQHHTELPPGYHFVCDAKGNMSATDPEGHVLSYVMVDSFNRFPKDKRAVIDRAWDWYEYENAPKSPDPGAGVKWSECDQ